PNLRFDFAKDFAPVTPLTLLPLILAVNPSLGVASVQELVALAKSKPGELTYASVGIGTVPHLSSELFAVRTHIKLVHVPYQGRPRRQRGRGQAAGARLRADGRTARRICAIHCAGGGQVDRRRRGCRAEEVAGGRLGPRPEERRVVREARPHPEEREARLEGR